MQEELNYLNYTINKYDEVIDDSTLKLSHLKELYKFDYDAMLDEKFKLQNEIKSLFKNMIGLKKRGTDLFFTDIDKLKMKMLNELK